mmetsp:Transcript_7453/g.20681  ORF Transcript_7453/g.20681 Transcript_7453/m.20681 type:complete len:110 (-) Transcript_7453:1881-2210(-)
MTDCPVVLFDYGYVEHVTKHQNNHEQHEHEVSRVLQDLAQGQNEDRHVPIHHLQKCQYLDPKKPNNERIKSVPSLVVNIIQQSGYESAGNGTPVKYIPQIRNMSSQCTV